MRSASLTALLLALAAAAAPAPARAETRRLAVIVGNNAGTGELPALRYAEADAGKVARVLVELGQVPPEDLYLLQGRPVGDLEKVLSMLTARVAEIHRAPDARAVLIFFFSGHSDGEGLEMGRERLLFPQLKSMLTATGAEVRLAFIDACRSGAAILAKGGKPAPAFAIRLSDELNTTGEAFLTSSAADEIALESREVAGSYFTHHLVSGLRGAADSSGDGQVTLAEAYRYAYDKTLSATAATLGGAQHPAYDFRLSGQGELVLTMLQKASASLELPPNLDRALVTDVTRDQVVAEMAGSSGRAVALTPGTYGVRAFKGGRAFGGRFAVAPGQKRVVAFEELRPIELPVVAQKGPGGPAPAPPPPQQPPAAATRRKVDAESFNALSLGFGASKSIAGGIDWAGDLRVGWEPARFFRLSLLGSYGNALSNTFVEYSLQLRAGFHLYPHVGPVTFLLGVELGPGVFWQTASGTDAGYSFALVGGPRLGIRVDLAGPVFAGLEGEALGGVVAVDHGTRVVFLPGGTLSVGLNL
ncbi:MAG TPA: caspase family protein [Myxococcales bacterium]